ncbi:MAG: hypothetical protein AB199_01320 [Parcubacteria bacterium C7867-004]|nr:MAG: hypothetical protein AB199_01320 [Parcubacteria bacterium C7867-004]
MPKHILFRIFFICLISCASMMLVGIWNENQIEALIPWYFQASASFFIVGLGCFLTWFSITLNAIRQSSKRS